MTSLWVVGVAHVFLASAPPATGAVGNAVTPAFPVRVVLHVALAADELALARVTAGRLLAEAGVRADWEQCSALEALCHPPHRREVVVRLLPTRAAGVVSGHLIRDPRNGSTALVHVPAHQEQLRKVLVSSAARGTPALSGLRLGHLLGLTIAHEVGHALGLRHAPAGVMRARAGVDDLLALRRSALAFQRDEAVQMRLAAEGQANQVARRSR